MGAIWDAIDAEIIKPRVDAAYENGGLLAKLNIEEFYSQGSPKIYYKGTGKRTGAYKNSLKVSPLSKDSSGYHYRMELITPPYETGTITPDDVMYGIQMNAFGILGKPYTWDEAEEDIKGEAVRAFS